MKTTLLIITIIHIIKPVPVAIFHGIGDNCKSNGMKIITKLTQNNVEDYAKCIESAGGIKDFFKPIKDQAKNACNEIKKDENFQNEFSILSFSQGGLIARYIIEKCDMKGYVKKFVSFGGPLMGTSKAPKCIKGVVCHFVNNFVSFFIYFNYVQNGVGPAGYYRDNFHLERYLDKSNFLAELNNEKNFNQSYYDRMSNLTSLVLIKFNNDTMIYPPETSWFQSLDQDNNLISLSKSEFYEKDFIGIRKLNENGVIKFIGIDGEHLDFTNEDLYDYAFDYLI